MKLTDPIRYAGVSAWLAIPALALSVVFVAMFFSGAGGLYGSLNVLIGRVIGLSASFATGTVGILPVLVWALAQSYLGLRYGVPSRHLGWSMLTVVLEAGLVSAVSAVGLQTATWTLTAVLLAAMSVYLAVLGRVCMSAP